MCGTVHTRRMCRGDAPVRMTAAPVNLSFPKHLQGIVAGRSLAPDRGADGKERRRHRRLCEFYRGEEVFDDSLRQAAPGAGTAPFSINLCGAVTGEFIDANDVMHGFSRLAYGEVMTFDAPDAGTMALQGTRPSTNNMEGEVVGWYVDAQNATHAFIWQPQCDDSR